MKTIFKVIGLLLVLVVVAALVIPLFISTDDLVEPIAGQVKSATGRELAIDGDSSLSIFPALALQLNQVRLSNMATGSRPDMVKMQQLDVHIPWMSLFSGELQVERFVIREPDILLETDADGNANWDLVAAAEPVAEEDTGAGLPAGFDIKLDNVAIEGGTLKYVDGQAGSEQLLEQLGLAISLPSLHENLQISGSITYLDEPFTITLTVTTPAGAMSGSDFDLSAGVGSRLINLDYAGNISADGAVGGTLTLAVDSVKQLLAWQEIEMEAKEEALNKLELSADMLYSNDALSLSKLDMRLDALQVTGSSKITLSEVPLIAADVDLGMLDANPYLPEQTAPDGAAPKAEPAADAPPEPLVWDSTPIDLSGLKAVNADISLRSSGIVFQEIKLGASEMDIAMDDGRASITLKKFDAYEGSGKGTVAVNARRSPYAIDTDFSLTGVQAQPLLTDAAGFDKLLGTGVLNWQLKTTGVSQKDFVGALAGELKFSFKDGAVKGANIAQILRGAKSALTGDIAGAKLGLSFDDAAATDFSELGGSMQFSKGVGKNNDLTLASPLLRVTGNGELDLPAAKIDYVVKAGLVSSIEGQGSDKAQGVAIPIRIKGPFHDVKIKPDYGKAATESLKDQAIDKMKNFFKN
jgi:AsmA protein